MKFTPSDFFTTDEELSTKEAARLANEKLKEWLDSAPIVLGYKTRNGTWVFGEDFCSEIDTHNARVVMIEKLK